MRTNLLIEREGATERWTLNNPETRNALSEDMVEALFAACERSGADSSLRFIVLRGTGGSFCAGGSLGSFSRTIGKSLPEGESDPLIPMSTRFGQLLQTLCQLPQILIAQVEGAAMGGGFGLVCCADFILAADNAVFATPEVTLGIVPAQIAPYVQLRLGDKAARRILFSGKHYSATEMQTLGLVDEVHPAPHLTTAVQQSIQSLSPAAPRAVASAKALLFMPFEHIPPAITAQAAIKFAASLRSSEASEGLQAFAQKRKATWNV